MKPESEKPAEEAEKPKPLEEGRDYYFDNGLMVLTAHFLLERGYCCHNGCRHCPYPGEDAEDL